MPPRLGFLFPLFLLGVAGTLASLELVLESGYSISTVIDFNKPIPSGASDGSALHPSSLLPLTRSPGLLLLLDSTHSSFYSLELPLSQESKVRLFSGKGIAGFSDGDPTSAMFNRPRSFAVDSNDNVYVADRINHAIRKISSSSGMTTTVAGGYSRKPGHSDGPAQNATFSEDFDLLYMPKMCTLLISDRGNRMIRQMDLKPEDCKVKSQSSKGLGIIPVTIVAVISLLCGSAFGFIARPAMTSSSSELSISHCILHSWNHIRATPRKPARMFCSGIRSVVASSKALHLMLLKLANFSIGYLHVVFQSIRLEKQVHGKEHVLLLDADFESRHHAPKLQPTDGMKDLLDFSFSLTNKQFELQDAPEGLPHDHDTEKEESLTGKITNMMKSNLLEFTDQSKRQDLVKRKKNGLHDFPCTEPFSQAGVVGVDINQNKFVFM